MTHPQQQLIALTRQRVEAAIRAAVERMPRYFGAYIHASDFVDDALLYALDEALAADAVLQAEDALLREVVELRRRLFTINEHGESVNTEAALSVGQQADWIDRLAADIHELNPDYLHFEAEVVKLIRATLSAGAVPQQEPQYDHSNCLDSIEVKATLREWARMIRAAESQHDLLVIADDLDVNAGAVPALPAPQEQE